MTIHDALRQIDPEVGKQLAKTYFGACSAFPGTGHYTGSHFESFVGAANPEYEITAADLLAVQMLAVPVPSRAVIGILETFAPRISELLTKINPEMKLEDVTDEQFACRLGKESPARALWDLLRRNAPDEQRWYVGETLASKIMARKRPHLIPIDDSVVTRVIGRGRKDSWKFWWRELREDSYLIERADEIRRHVDRPELSTLRALDIVLWQYGKS